MKPEQIADVDVVVVGAGFGGLYAVHRLKQQGLDVVGLEAARGIGGVWYHNRYPGARVDLESLEYCYHFSPELYREWRWTERYAAQSELLAYLNHVADRFGLRDKYRFNTRMNGATWDPVSARWQVATDQGVRFAARFLVMATGNLSAPRKPDFPGLDDFRGEWFQTARWPHGKVELAGKRIGVIGTGSSGVQTITTVAPIAQHLHVFQRTPNYAVPARNRPLDAARFAEMRERVPENRHFMFTTRMGMMPKPGPAPKSAPKCSPEEQRERLEAQWEYGGYGMTFVFSDQGLNPESNDLVADFVRGKIRGTVKDPAVAEALCPFDHPIGTRRLCIMDGYYETYNRDNVTLVNLRDVPIERITETGIRTAAGDYDLDVIIFALGFHAFTGAVNGADIRNERGRAPTHHWTRGPRTQIGLMTTGFPNFFMPTGPGSPSVLANMALGNEQHVDWIADCIAHMDAHGHRSIVPTAEGEAAWTQHVAEVSAPFLRRQVKNYMVHVNDDDQSRVFMPYIGGMDRYTEALRQIAESGYEGFAFA